jgi:hypothetical protein
MRENNTLSALHCLAQLCCSIGWVMKCILKLRYFQLMRDLSAQNSISQRASVTHCYKMWRNNSCELYSHWRRLKESLCGAKNILSCLDYWICKWIPFARKLKSYQTVHLNFSFFFIWMLYLKKIFRYHLSIVLENQDTSRLLSHPWF